jgi:FkbM family methyltransferase
MKHIIKKILRNAGWELRRVESNYRPSMREGLKWLANHGFHFNTVLDVGASDGRWSAECMAFYPEAKYILFEPHPVHSKALDDFANSRRQTVILVKKAVEASEGYSQFYAATPLGGALADKEGDHTIKVSLTTIDATVLVNQVEAPYLLKLDTHGAEKRILAGSTSALQKCDALITEAYNFSFGDFLFWELCSFLAEKGFRPVDLVDVLHRPYDDALFQMDLFFIRSTWKGFDYLSYV